MELLLLNVLLKHLKTVYETSSIQPQAAALQETIVSIFSFVNYEKKRSRLRFFFLLDSVVFINRKLKL